MITGVLFWYCSYTLGKFGIKSCFLFFKGSLILFGLIFLVVTFNLLKVL